MIKPSWFIYTVLAFLVLSCGPNEEETATKGHLRVLVSESVAPVLEEEVNQFMSLYKARGADVSCAVMQSEEADNHFVYDTARMIITTIPLTPQEKDRVKNTTDHLVDIVLAYDGVIAVVRDDNPRNNMTVRQMQDVLNGRVATWNELGRPRRDGRIHVMLEDSSDVSMYLSRRLLGGKEISARFRHTSSSRQTLQEVADDSLSLGFVGLNWFDSAGTRIKILALAADSSVADTSFKPPPESIGHAYSPHPAHLYLNYYPLKRAIFVYARTTPGDFATGFASYLASPAGQRIFLNEGLVPGTQKIVLKSPEEQ